MQNIYGTSVNISDDCAAYFLTYGASSYLFVLPTIFLGEKAVCLIGYPWAFLMFVRGVLIIYDAVVEYRYSKIRKQIKEIYSKTKEYINEKSA